MIPKFGFYCFKRKMNTKVINLISGPACGKTLTAALIFAHLKLQGKNAEYVSEYAKKLVWLGDFENLNNQYYVSLKQFKLMKAMVGKIEYLVADCSLLQGLYYNKFYPDNTSNIEKTEKKIWDLYNSFEKNINIFLVRGDYPYEEAGRYQNEDEAKAIDAELEKILIDNNVQYAKFKSGFDSITEILEYINSQS